MNVLVLLDLKSLCLYPERDYIISHSSRQQQAPHSLGVHYSFPWMSFPVLSPFKMLPILQQGAQMLFPPWSCSQVPMLENVFLLGTVLTHCGHY